MMRVGTPEYVDVVGSGDPGGDVMVNKSNDGRKPTWRIDRWVEASRRRVWRRVGAESSGPCALS